MLLLFLYCYILSADPHGVNRRVRCDVSSSPPVVLPLGSGSCQMWPPRWSHDPDVRLPPRSPPDSDLSPLSHPRSSI